MAMLASPFVLDIATAEPADAAYACDAGWNLEGSRCTRQVRQASHGCNAGWNNYNASYCYQPQQYCPSGGYLSGGRCNIWFWGRLSQYAPSTRWILQPKTTTYRWVRHVQPARWISGPAQTFVAPSTTTTTGGQIINGFPPAGNMIYRNGCQPRVVSSLEIRRFQNDHSHVNDGGSMGWFRDLAVIDRNNMEAGCTSNGGRLYRYHLEYRKTARVACTSYSSGYGASCDAANFTYDTNLWGQGPGHNLVR